MGCRPWQIKSAVAPTSCLARLLSLAYGTALAIASCRVACCSPRFSLSFTSVTFLCSSGCLFKRWYVRLDVLVEYEIATAGSQSLQYTFFLSIIFPFESPGNPKYSHALLLAFGRETSCSYYASAMLQKLPRGLLG